MSKLEIIVAPDDRLNKVCKKVEKIEQNTFSFLEDMLTTMYANNGIGLAAPQVGKLSRLVVMDCSSEKSKKAPYKFINPEIIEKSENFNEFEEGCLSIPGQTAKIKRPETVKIKYINEQGVSIIKKFDGLEATCIQHEIDHLNGILFFDHLSKLKKNIILKKLIKHKKFKNKK